MGIGAVSTHLGTPANAIAVEKGPVEGAEKVQCLSHSVDPALISLLQGPRRPETGISAGACARVGPALETLGEHCRK